MTTTTPTLARRIIDLPEVLRAAADLLAAHPELPPPYITTSAGPDRDATADLSWYLMLGARSGDLEAQKAAAQQIIRAIGGEWKKIPDTYADFLFWQERDGLRLDVMVTREAVCERIVTGTESVTIPAKAAEPERTVEREIVEWRCEPVLSGETS